MPEETTHEESQTQQEKTTEQQEKSTEETQEQEQEQKGEEQKTPGLLDQEEKQQEEQKKTEIPEKYEFKFPEGMEPDENLVKQMSDFAKEIGLGQEEAQKAMDHYIGAQRAALDVAIEETKQQINEWAEESKKMWGDQFDANRAEAARAFATVASDIPELTPLVESMGLGTHPAMLKLFHHIAKFVNEDKVEEGKMRPGKMTEEEKLNRMYPKTKAKE